MAFLVRLLLLAYVSLTKAGPQATKVIRFKDPEGQVHYGQPISGKNDLAIPLVGNDPFVSLELFDVKSQPDKILKVKKLLAPIPMPPTIFGIGFNYWGHINSTNVTAPKTPSLFYKNRFAYNHPFDPIIVPPVSTLPDYEGELAIIIGKNCKDVSEEDALSCVLGYTVCHDFSARCLQEEDPHDPKRPSYHQGCLGNGGQFSYLKGLDTHAPFGPAMVPTSVLGDGSGLRLTTWVNKEKTPRQNTSTSDLIFGVRKIVSFISTGTTLEKGSVFCSGTPDGVGDTMSPPKYLHDGDIVNISIDRIGSLINPVRRPGSQHQEEPVNLDMIV
jgi:2-keto-4-pentenoate hydratase/2-oxohepta-3-ene-1,7-dioic acid hydratase in catechol pathway